MVKIAPVSIHEKDFVDYDDKGRPIRISEYNTQCKHYQKYNDKDEIIYSKTLYGENKPWIEYKVIDDNILIIVDSDGFKEARFYDDDGNLLKIVK